MQLECLLCAIVKCLQIDSHSVTVFNMSPVTSVIHHFTFFPSSSLNRCSNLPIYSLSVQSLCVAHVHQWGSHSFTDDCVPMLQYLSFLQNQFQQQLRHWWHFSRRLKSTHCNNETEAALCAASKAWCLPSKSGSTEGCSSCFGRTRRRLALREGKERCIKLTTTCYMYSGPRVYYVCAVRRVRSRGAGSEVRVPSPGRFRYRFQHSRNRYITTQHVANDQPAPPIVFH